MKFRKQIASRITNEKSVIKLINHCRSQYQYHDCNYGLIIVDLLDKHFYLPWVGLNGFYNNNFILYAICTRFASLNNPSLYRAHASQRILSRAFLLHILSTYWWSLDIYSYSNFLHSLWNWNQMKGNLLERLLCYCTCRS